MAKAILSLPRTLLILVSGLTRDLPPGPLGNRLRVAVTPAVPVGLATAHHPDEPSSEYAQRSALVEWHLIEATIAATRYPVVAYM